MEERAAAGLNEPPPPVLNGDDRGHQGVARPPRQFTGMGLMGVGMLAQTKVMGMQIWLAKRFLGQQNLLQWVL